MTSVLVADSKYQFVPPHEGKLWPRLLGRLMPHFLKRKHGITEIEVRGDEAIRRLQQSGHGIVLAPNHCRMSDAIVLQSLSRQLNQPFYIMANLAIGGKLAEENNDLGVVNGITPAEFLIDWIRIYQCSADRDTGLACMQEQPGGH